MGKAKTGGFIFIRALVTCSNLFKLGLSIYRYYLPPNLKPSRFATLPAHTLSSPAFPLS